MPTTVVTVWGYVPLQGVSHHGRVDGSLPVGVRVCSQCVI